MRNHVHRIRGTISGTDRKIAAMVKRLEGLYKVVREAEVQRENDAKALSAVNARIEEIRDELEQRDRQLAGRSRGR